MMRYICCLILFLAASLPSAFAVGGACPAASTYMEPVSGLTTGTLSSFGITSCFYVDFVGGADTNAGTSEGAPWKHAPGMAGCTGNCSSTSLVAGEGFILKGGTVWDNTTQQWTWSQAGSGGSPIYIGYDPAWFSAVTGTVNTQNAAVTLNYGTQSYTCPANCVTWVSGLHRGITCTGSTPIPCASGTPIPVGDFVASLAGQTITIGGTGFTVNACYSSMLCSLTTAPGTRTAAASSFSVWTRPIIDALNGTTISSTQLSITGTFVDVDNLELAYMYNTAASGSQTVFAITVGSGNRDLHLYNLYLHGADVAHDGSHASHYISWSTSGNDNTSTTHHNVLDNSDFCVAGGLSSSNICSMTAQEGGPRQIFMNYTGYMGGSTYVVDNPIDFHNNTMEWQTLSIDSGVDHENMLESNGETGSGMVLYNNVVRNGYNCGIVDFQMGPNTGITSYAFNNVLPNMDGCNMEQHYEGGSAPGATYWFNNTAEGGPEGAVTYNSNANPPSGGCGRNTASGHTANIINQHCVTTATGTTWWNAGTGTNNFTTNLAQSKATANAQGYTLGSTYSFQPTLVSGGTVGIGTNETSLCTAISSGATTITAVNTAAGTACQRDTSYGVSYDVVSHSITGVGRSSTNARPSAGAWDAGAYQFSSVTLPALAPAMFADLLFPPEAFLQTSAGAP